MSSKKPKFNDEVSEFSQFLVHDLRSPLQVVTSLSDLLLNPNFEGIFQGQERLDKIDMLKENLLKFNGTLTKLLEFANENISDHKIYSLTELIENKLKLFNIELIGKLPTVDLKGFPESMSKSLDALITNAIEANTSRNKPTIEMISSDNNYIIKIYNDGTLSEDEIRKMHKPFISKKDKRHGIGISYARQVIKNHGGSLNHSNQNKLIVTEIKLPTSID